MNKRFLLSAVVAATLGTLTSGVFAASPIGGPRAIGAVAKPIAVDCDTVAAAGAMVAMNEGRLSDLWPASNQRCRAETAVRTPRIGGPRSTH